MTEIRWLTVPMVVAFHRESIARFGGMDGIRDAAGLASALARPRNLAAYGDEASIFDMAAATCAGIVGNHPFVDGKKRTGILAAAVFLALNGYRFQPEEAKLAEMIWALAHRRVDAAALAQWMAESTLPASG